MENANTTVAPDRCALLHEPSRAGLLHILDHEERWHGWIGTDLHSDGSPCESAAEAQGGRGGSRLRLMCAVQLSFVGEGCLLRPVTPEEAPGGWEPGRVHRRRGAVLCMHSVHWQLAFVRRWPGDSNLQWLAPVRAPSPRWARRWTRTWRPGQPGVTVARSSDGRACEAGCRLKLRTGVRARGGPARDPGPIRHNLKGPHPMSRVLPRVAN